jgi:Flp pilus assembly protein protease CpaA
MTLDLFFLAPLSIIGIICSYTDIRYGKIKNKWLIAGFAWAFLLYIFLFLYALLFDQGGNIAYLGEMALNGIVALIVGYFLWNFGLLAAGDAKLFALYAFLIPHSFYANAYFPVFPSLVLLANVFIPLVIFLTFKALIFGVKTLAGKVGNSGLSAFKINPGELLKKLPGFLRIYVAFVLMMVIIQLARQKASESFENFDQIVSPVFLFLFLFFIYRILFKLISKNKIIGTLIMVAGVASISYLFFTGQVAFLLNILKLALVFMVLIGFTYRILNFYIEKKEVRSMGAGDLKEGMFLGRGELKGELEKKIGPVGRTGLSQEQLKAIKDSLGKDGNKEVMVYKTFALAPFVFIGACFTVIFRDSVVGVVVKLFTLAASMI